MPLTGDVTSLGGVGRECASSTIGEGCVCSVLCLLWAPWTYIAYIDRS